MGVHQNHRRFPHSLEASAGATTSPVIEPLPTKNPKISSVPALTGTSFATGSPCLVMTTVSFLAFTSSMMARQFVLNAPAGIVFIARLRYNYGHYTMVV